MIAGVVVAPVVALIATGCIGYLIFVVIQTTTWPLWYPVGQLLSLGGVDGFETRDLGGVFDALGALASSLVVDGLVALGVVGLFLLLLDLLSPIAFVPDRIIAKVGVVRTVLVQCARSRHRGLARVVGLHRVPAAVSLLEIGAAPGTA